MATLDRELVKCKTLGEALKLKGLDFEVQVEDLFVRGPKNPRTGNSTVIVCPRDFKCVRRTDNGDVMAAGVKSGYTPLQYGEVMGPWVDRAIGKGAKIRYLYSLDGGASVKLQMDSPYVCKILGEEYFQSFNISTGHTGGDSCLAWGGRRRKTCDNQLVLGFHVKSNQIIMTEMQKAKIRHSASAKERFEVFKRAFDHTAMAEQNKRINEAADKLARIKFSEAKWNGLVEQLIPMPNGDLTKRVLNNIKERRSQFYNSLNQGDLENFKRTGWGFIQAATHFADHAPPGRRTEHWEARRMLVASDGSPLVKRAVELVLASN